MSARREITKEYAKAYRSASKSGKARMLDELVAVAGWSRANARRAVSAAGRRRGPVRVVVRKQRAPIYGYDTLKVLQQVWAKMRGVSEQMHQSGVVIPNRGRGVIGDPFGFAG